MLAAGWPLIEPTYIMNCAILASNGVLLDSITMVSSELETVQIHAGLATIFMQTFKQTLFLQTQRTGAEISITAP
jgi:hypothetical protein